MCEQKSSLNIMELNSNTLVLEGIYNISKSQLEQFKRKTDLIKELAVYKRKFMDSDSIVETLTVLNSFWVDVFLYLESIKECDLAVCSYKDILKFFTFLKDNNKITYNIVFF